MFMMNGHVASSGLRCSVGKCKAELMQTDRALITPCRCAPLLASRVLVIQWKSLTQRQPHILRELQSAEWSHITGGQTALWPSSSMPCVPSPLPRCRHSQPQSPGRTTRDGAAWIATKHHHRVRRSCSHFLGASCYGRAVRMISASLYRGADRRFAEVAYQKTRGNASPLGTIRSGNKARICTRQLAVESIPWKLKYKVSA
jgi:hypothetical protein